MYLGMWLQVSDVSFPYRFTGQIGECVWSQVSLGLYSLEALKETGYHLDRVTNQRGPATEASISTRSH